MASSSTPNSPPPTKKRKLVQDAAADTTNGDIAKHVSEDLNTSELATPTMSKLEKSKAKKRKKEYQKALENPPTFSFDTRGFKGGRMIQIKDVRDLMLHLLSDEKAQQWLYIANKRNIQRVVAVMIPGITSQTLGIPQRSYSANGPFSLIPSEEDQTELSSQLPVFQTLFSHACPTKAPGEKNKMHSAYQHFMLCSLTNGEKDRREKARKEQGKLSKTKDASVYLMTREQMTEQLYPVPSPVTLTTQEIEQPSFQDWIRADGWIEAPYKKPEKGLPKVLGIDCEMCLTEDGSELTRVSVVDLKGNRIFDSLVKPSKPILDYLTRYSGLNEEKLSNVTTNLLDVQKQLTEFIDYNTILIGHSLECDLRVLKLVHSRVIDTSVIFQHPRGPPFKASLKWLAQKWLKREIQNGVGVVGSNLNGGHDSEEDAKTCVDLLTLKMEKGPGFGEFLTDQETIFERISRGSDPKTSAVVDHGSPGQWHGAKCTTAISCSNDQQVLEGLLNVVPTHDFSLARFMDLSHALGWSQPSTAVPNGKSAAALSGLPAEVVAAALPSPANVSPVETVLSSLNEQIKALHAALPPLTALIIFTGHGVPQEMVRLSAKKAKFDRLWKTVKQSEISAADRWMESDDRNLVDEVEKCRLGLSFYCIK